MVWAARVRIDLYRPSLQRRVRAGGGVAQLPLSSSLPPPTRLSYPLPLLYFPCLPFSSRFWGKKDERSLALPARPRSSFPHFPLLPYASRIIARFLELFFSMRLCPECFPRYPSHLPSSSPASRIFPDFFVRTFPLLHSHSLSGGTRCRPMGNQWNEQKRASRPPAVCRDGPKECRRS